MSPAMAARKVFVVGDAERMVAQEGADQAANAFLKLLEEPPAGTYRLKGTVVVARGPGLAAYVVHVVGRTVHVEAVPVPADAASELVVIGQHLDPADAGRRLDAVMAAGPDAERPVAEGLQRLERLRRLSR